ncbi:ubiquitin fusion degradation protein 1 [Angomonas deanei]|nr:ubiquitin fusion degradation protein 1 [Angomonas deanei]|eukprot:EPY38534.1 ubiquitin fusion degradation protein 1 [Angomonas deanei]
MKEGSRVLLPASFLSEILRMNVPHPYYFSLQPYGQKKESNVFAAVKEFTSEEGCVVLPDWMMQHMKVKEGSSIKIRTCALPHGDLIVLTPHETDFTKLTDTISVLQQHVQNHYPVLFKPSTILVHHAGHDFLIDVNDIKDGKGNSMNAITTVHNVGYTTELKVSLERPLDMPPSPEDSVSSPVASNVIGSPSGIPSNTTFQYAPPTLTEDESKEAEAKERFQAFSGTGKTLSDSAPAAPKAAEVIPDAEELRRIREKRLKALSKR